MTGTVSKIAAVCVAGLLVSSEATAGPRGGAARAGSARSGGPVRGGGQVHPGASAPRVSAPTAGPSRSGAASAGQGIHGGQRPLPQATSPGTRGPLGAGAPTDVRAAAGQRPASSADSLQTFLGVAPQHSPASAAANRTMEPGQMAHEVQAMFGSGAQPFTPAWYADHPYAFQAAYPHADAWVAATTTGLARWVGAATYAVAADGGTTYVTEEPATETTTSQEPASESAPPAPAQETATASQAIENAPAQEELMGIGVYGLAEANQKEATRLLNLAAARNGAVQGSYYDAVSETVSSVKGQIDKHSMVMTWSVGEKSEMTFEMSLADLSQAKIAVTARLPNGKTGMWQLIKATK